MAQHILVSSGPDDVSVLHDDVQGALSTGHATLMTVESPDRILFIDEHDGLHAITDGRDRSLQQHGHREEALHHAGAHRRRARRG